jgi:hypothetical protein
MATTIAYDTASDPVYANLNYEGLNGGFGFKPWVMDAKSVTGGVTTDLGGGTSSYYGSFMWTSQGNYWYWNGSSYQWIPPRVPGIDSPYSNAYINGVAWGVFANYSNGYSTLYQETARRDLQQPLGVGQTLSAEWSNDYLTLATSGNQIAYQGSAEFAFRFGNNGASVGIGLNADQFYGWNTPAYYHFIATLGGGITIKNIQTTLPAGSSAGETGGMLCTITRSSFAGYSIIVTQLDSGQTWSTVYVSTAPLTGIASIDAGAGPGALYDVYTNYLSVTK